VQSLGNRIPTFRGTAVTSTVEDAVTAIRRNFGILLPGDTALHPRRMNSSITPLQPLKMHTCILRVPVFLVSHLIFRLFSSLNFIVPPNFIGPLRLVFLLSQHYSSSVLLLPLHIDHLFSHSPSIYSSPQCSSHYLLPTTAPPIHSVLFFTFHS
jgi:hypothetical protein